MNYQLKLNGIYDLRTLNCAKDLGLKHFGFNLRPLSLNLVPVSDLIESLLVEIDSDSSVYFEFQDQTDGMISYLDELLVKKSFKFKNIFIHINKITDCEISHINNRRNLVIDYDEKITDLSGMNFSSIRIGQSQLSNFGAKSKIQDQLYGINGFKANLELVVEDHLLEKHLNTFDFSSVCLELNNNFEVCYRNINLNLLNDRLLNIINICEKISNN